MIEYPTDSYLQAFARAQYAVSDLEWLLLGDLPKLSVTIEGFSIEELSTKTPGCVAQRTREASKLPTITDPERVWLERAATALEKVVGPRNDIVHAHPVTTQGGTQTLNRWAVVRGKQKSVEITEKFLTELTTLANKHLDGMHKVRLP